METNTKLLDRTADIVTAYITKNPLPATELPGLIKTVHSSLSQGAVVIVEPIPEVRAPHVSIKKSITADHLICLEDGRKFKSLKRHLLSKYGLTPDAYRTKWGLPKDYPMVAPSYSVARSELAKKIGLGAKGSQAPKGKVRAKA